MSINLSSLKHTFTGDPSTQSGSSLASIDANIMTFADKNQIRNLKGNSLIFIENLGLFKYFPTDNSIDDGLTCFINNTTNGRWKLLITGLINTATTKAAATIMASKITPTIEYSNILRYITSTQLSSYLGIFFPNCGGYLAGYIDKDASTRYYYFAAPNLSGGHSPFSIPWFAPGVDQPNLVNVAYASYTWPGLLKSSIANTTTATGTGFNGQANTTAIYNAGDTTAGYAAGFAETLNININGTIFYDYFLGSVYEMDMCYRNIQAFNANAINDERWKLGLYWTSTEFNASYAWFVDYDYESYGGTVDGYLKGSPAWVRALRRFTI